MSPPVSHADPGRGGSDAVGRRLARLQGPLHQLAMPLVIVGTLIVTLGVWLVVPFQELAHHIFYTAAKIGVVMIARIAKKLGDYWTLTKSPQTGLLLVTGLAGYSSARCPVVTWQTLLGLAGSLFLAISGSTVLNMVYDRDIDAMMKRTCWRPLPVGSVSVREALALGATMVVWGMIWAMLMSPLFAVVVAAGVFFDLVVYTLWLKRRSPHSIILGGLAGAMPVLAGRVLATGRIDGIGLLLALSVLLWIPTHIMTFSIRYAEDYAQAGVPTFPSVYGVPVTRLLMSLSSVGAAMSIMAAAILISMSWGYLRFLAFLGVALLALAAANVLRPSARLNFGLFKFASLYMLCSMLLVMTGAL